MTQSPRTTPTASLLAVEGCTGLAASWCPVCGECTCPYSEDDPGEIAWHYEPGIVSFHGFPAYCDTAKIVVHYDHGCPLHGETSAHTETVAA